MDERGHLVPFLQSPQKPPHPGAGQHAAALRTLCSEPVRRLHPAQPPHTGGSDGVFNGPRAEVVAAADLTILGGKINLGVGFSAKSLF